MGDSARARASSERSSTSTTDILKKIPLWVGTVSTEGRGRGVDAATSSTRGSSLDFRIGTRVQQERHGEDSLTRHRPSTRFGPHPTACYSFFPPPRALKFGISSILLNRIVSGVAAVSDAGSSQSRADVIGIVLSASCVLTGLQWSSIKARTYPKVDQGGVVVSFVDESVGLEASQEIRWCYDSLTAASSCACAMVVFYKGRCVAHLGRASSASAETKENAVMGPMCTTMVDKDRGNYIPNLKVYPGRIEFAYLPDTVQALILQPLGEDGVVLVCSDTQRGFTKIDQSWIATMSDKLDSTLSSS